jgi:hypothetical protein
MWMMNVVGSIDPFFAFDGSVSGCKGLKKKGRGERDEVKIS